MLNVKSNWFLILFFTTACTSAPKIVTKHKDPAGTPIHDSVTSAEGPIAVTPVNEVEPSPPAPNLVPTPAVTPVFGVIMSPSGLRSFYAIGVLQELAKSRLQIRAIAGTELSALVAALYAHHGQVYEAEWQMMKIKESELIHHSMWGADTAQSVESLDTLLKDVFSNDNLGQAKIQFLCPTE